MSVVPLSDEQIHFRMDFSIDIMRADDATRTAYFTVVPDPRRYITVERDGGKFYLDKYLRHLISAEEMNKSIADKLVGLPVFNLAPTIKSTPEYADRRLSAISSEIRTGTYILPDEKAVRHTPLENDKNTRDIAFLSVDICGSSALRANNQEAFDRAYQIFVRELGTLVGQFNGSIFKLTGDGFIAFIDHPSFTRQCDNAVDMGLSFLVVIRDSVNPALHEVGLPQLKIRVGADYGPAKIQQIEIPSTGYLQTDVASNALNKAVKIEQSCEDNEFRIGRRLYELIHVQWLERAQKVSFDGTSFGVPDYEVYRLN